MNCRHGNRAPQEIYASARAVNLEFLFFFTMCKLILQLVISFKVTVIINGVRHF